MSVCRLDHRHRLAPLLAALVAASAAGCGDDDPTGAAGGGGSSSEGGGGATPVATTSTGSAGGGEGGAGGAGPVEGLGPIVWGTCAASSDDAFGTGAECATITAPARWDDPSVGRIELFVKRFRGGSQPAATQVWFLNGGPGYSGADYDAHGDAIVKAEPTLDVYLLDHRGTGRSSRLGCEEAEDPASDGGRYVTVDEMPACVDGLVETWGARLDGFSTTNAARDVGEIIAATLEEGQQVVVDGGSYGSHWANRYMQLYPDQPAGVILDAPAVNSHLSRIDAYFDDLGHRWAARCAEDTLCADKLGDDPAATWAAALDRLDDGSCAVDPRLDRASVHALFAFFFYVWDYRPLVAPVVHRLARCEPRDVRALDAFADALFAEPGEPTASERYFSPLLSNHIALSEMWQDTTMADVDAFRDQALVTHGSLAETVPLQDLWPRYPAEDLFGVHAASPARTFIVHGQYDFLPVEEVVMPTVEHFAGDRSQYVEIPNAPHSTFQSPIGPQSPTCGAILIMQLFRAPTEPVDTSCTALVQDISFEVPAGLAAGVFGTADAWDGDPSGGGGVAPPPAFVLRGGPAEALRQRLRFASRR